MGDIKYCSKCRIFHCAELICKVGKNVQISANATINVTEHFEVGEGSIINDYAKIEGRKITIGREAWIHEYSWIGGGSCFEQTSELIAGDFLHLGKFAHINTAAGVKIGDEVGIGHGSNIWTHGAYPPMDYGFPFQFSRVSIGDRTWLPHAWVNPGVNIGVNVVVAAMSLVNKDLPSRCYAAGIPAQIIQTDAFPNNIKFNPMDLSHFLKMHFEHKFKYDYKNGRIEYRNTIFDLEGRKIKGPADKDTERLKNLLRRCGIRFRYEIEDGEYALWK